MGDLAVPTAAEYTRAVPEYGPGLPLRCCDAACFQSVLACGVRVSCGCHSSLFNTLMSLHSVHGIADRCQCRTRYQEPYVIYRIRKAAQTLKSEDICTILARVNPGQTT